MVASAFPYLHARRVMHRELKPQNLAPAPTLERPNPPSPQVVHGELKPEYASLTPTPTPPLPRTLTRWCTVT